MRKLNLNDEIRVIAPSRSMSMLNQETINNAINILQNMGLNITFGKNVMNYDIDYNCASIEDRINDLEEAFLDNNVKGILTVIGGYNLNQLLRFINFDIIKNNPKIICGFSDITTLLNSIYTKTGIPTFYGPHFSSFGMKKGCQYTIDYFKKIMFNNDDIIIESSKEYSDDKWFVNQSERKFIKNEGMKILREGNAEGVIVGGNLTSFNSLQGSEFMPSLKDKILFLENVDLIGNDYFLEFDRNFESLTQLKDFEYVKGIVIGRSQESANMSEEKWRKMLIYKRNLGNIPIIINCNFGHTTPIFTFPIGGKVKINASSNELSMKILKLEEESKC